ncbi:MAG: type I-C CRISPR-associated endonuclease Cas1c [Candidatus Loosdrechtia sp.]|uniref:type I-C CRISPR-associated endonuclease Cas1 n=1 Tax=Candidatus Loosdrechtia sp. TaxID=3101272 RepID=UPI003A681F11|nr:MAG: type I-C CRISPR-associated endonuclease Cas1c [Candidatus Jettenia sp. AMX2]
MKQLLNTLYVMTQGAYLTLDHETVKVEVEGKTQLQVPLHHLGAIFTIGNVMMSPFLMHRCTENGKAVVFLDMNGRFLARVIGKTTGNVLLRQAQYEVARDIRKAASLARNIVAAKIQNSRQIILRGARETNDAEMEAGLRQSTSSLADTLVSLKKSCNIDETRGLEGISANIYFQVFDTLVKENREIFLMKGRSRRPPRDPINALLSFLYTLLLNDCVSALEGVGLDPQVGFLHALRPGRPSLGLDLMEELRPVLADRLALTLINLKQITRNDFEKREGGSVYLSEGGRKTVVVAYQKRKQDEFTHLLMEEKVPFGLLFHVQARLLARHLRGDMEEYIPFLYS